MNMNALRLAWKKSPILTLLRYAAIFIWLLYVLIPIYTAFVASVTPFKHLGSSFLYPTHFTWENYVKLFTNFPFLNYLKSSFIYAFTASILSVITAALAAYAMSRYRFAIRASFIVLIFVVQTIPQIVIVISVFFLMNQLGLYDTYLAVILTIAATSISFPILLLTGFFRSLPVDLEEAALIDGCNRLGVLYRIVVPLAAPGVMTAFALAFFMGWAEFLLPLVLTISQSKIPLTVGIANLLDDKPPWELIMAGTLLSVLPAVLIYLSVQRFLVQGMVGGGVKG